MTIAHLQRKQRQFRLLHLHNSKEDVKIRFHVKKIAVATILLKSSLFVVKLEPEGGFQVKQIDNFVALCLHKGFITSEQAPWLRYGIEKRFSAVLVSIPMILLGAIISSPMQSLAFYITVYTLRTKTNGIHAKTPVRCCLFSLLGVAFFLGLLPQICNNLLALLIVTTSAVVIFLLAPYNHPNMSLSTEERLACAQSAKRHLLKLLLTALTLSVLHCSQIVTGILLGIVMVALSLVLAYILH